MFATAVSTWRRYKPIKGCVLQMPETDFQFLTEVRYIGKMAEARNRFGGLGLLIGEHN